MPAKSLMAILLVSVLPVAISAAQADCGSRPGTPNEVKAEALGGEIIRFSWRNTTHKGMNKSGSTSKDPLVKMWFDISVRNADGSINPQDKGGVGPFDVNYGSRHHQDYKTCVPCKLCFQIRARTAGGTKGCVSQNFSAQVCATTTAAVTPPTTRPVKPLGPPVLVATREAGNVFYVRGYRFQPNAAVAIRAVDGANLQGAIITTIGGNRITASANGLMGVRLHNICTKAKGPMSFSANDGRTNAADKTGTLWSNTVTVACQR